VTEENKATEAKQNETAKVTVTVTADAGVTFARKEYKKGDKITCTPGQAKILKAQRVAE
jgi:dihydroxyacetone kinase